MYFHMFSDFSRFHQKQKDAQQNSEQFPGSSIQISVLRPNGEKTLFDDFIKEQTFPLGILNSRATGILNSGATVLEAEGRL